MRTLLEQFLSLIMARTNYMMPNIFIVLTHWNSSPQVDTLLYSISLQQQSSGRHVAVLYLTETTVLRETRCFTLYHWNKQQSSGRHVAVLYLTETTVLRYTCCCTLSHWNNSPQVDTLLYSISLKQQASGRHVAVLYLTETTVLR